MLDLDSFNEIWGTISRNKARSIFTGLSVFWGIFMLLIMLGAGQGLKNGIIGGIDGFATNSCFMGSSTTSEPYMGFRKGRHWDIKNQDIEIIKKSVPELQYISPMLWGKRGVNNVVREEQTGSYGIRGVYPSFAEIEQQRLKFGRFINDVDILQKRKVCTIGIKVYENLFPGRSNPIGVFARINGIYYQIIGVTSGVAHVSIGGRTEESVFIPFTTLQQIENRGNVVHMVGATAKKGIDVTILEDKMKAILKENNHISPTDKQAIWGFSLEKQFKIFDNLFTGIAYLTWIVGMGTLFAGVIGVSNIMLITVRERTREIGVRRALGAKPLNILMQVLSESLLLTVIAGLIGLCVGVGLLGIVNGILEAIPATDGPSFSGMIVPFKTAIISMLILMIGGLIAGIFPAWRALQIKAIDAIREE